MPYYLENIPEFELEARLARHLGRIKAPDPGLEAPARRILDNLTKPKGSLGRLEDLAALLYRVQGGIRPLKAAPALMFTIAGDHGVAAKGVSSSPQSVTRQMVLNFLNGGAAINALCRSCGLDLKVVDAGVLGEDFPDHPNLVRAKIARGTADLSEGPAMSRSQCLRALLLGLDLAADAHSRGYACLGTGEMGIGNTTPSSALFCAWLGLSPEDATGLGAGLHPDKLNGKIAVIRQSLALHKPAIDSGRPMDVLAALGGLEIAALAGLILGAASLRLPILIDGFISSAACLAAVKLAPAARDYCIFAHSSAEAGHAGALKLLEQAPLLNLGLRLGEGSGAALGYAVLKAAVAMFNEMRSFSQAGVDEAGD